MLTAAVSVTLTRLRQLHTHQMMDGHTGCGLTGPWDMTLQYGRMGSLTQFPVDAAGRRVFRERNGIKEVRVVWSPHL